MFSRRLVDDAPPNALTRRLRELRAAGVAIDDLTVSNPTHADIPYPAGVLLPLCADASLRYAPEPFGLAAAREAVAADHLRRGARVDPGNVVLTASTSEAYSWLFKVLCDPGDSVLVPAPSYPLFEHLTRLEGVDQATYHLEYHGRWTIDFASVEAAPPRTRAVVAVSPNNPTGSYVTRIEFERLARICRERGWALIADEVFADYRLDAVEPLTDLAARAAECLTFTLGGFSKTLGLPQLKLGWIVAGGSDSVRLPALDRLEFVADTFLSVSTPVQVAAASLLRAGAAAREAIHARISRNLAALRSLAGRHPAVEVLTVEGGWSATLRVPSTRTEDELVLHLLESEHILVYPGYFFDFGKEAFLIVSLLPPSPRFETTMARLLRAVC